MRDIKHIVIHCSATPENKHFTARDIDNWHKKRGFKKIGYHYVVLLDGTIERGRSDEEVGAHVAGHNSNSIGICYIGGVDADDIKKAEDTRTTAQKSALKKLVIELTKKYPEAKVLGHRDFPKVAKACPSFDVKAWLTSEGLQNVTA